MNLSALGPSRRRPVISLAAILLAIIASWYFFAPDQTGFIWALEAPFLTLVLLFGATRLRLAATLLVPLAYMAMALGFKLDLHWWQVLALAACSLFMATVAAWTLGRIAARSKQELMQLGPLTGAWIRVLIVFFVSCAQNLVLGDLGASAGQIALGMLMQVAINIFGLYVVHCLAWPLLGRPRRRWRLRGRYVGFAGLMTLVPSLAVYVWVGQSRQLASGLFDPEWVLITVLLISAVICVFVLIVIDQHEQLITLLRRENMARRQSQRANRQLEESRRMASLGAMVAGIAHEVNTPLNVAKLGLDNLRQQLGRLQQMGVDIPQEQRQRMAFSLGRVASNLDRAGELMNQFKDVSGHSTSNRVASVVMGVLLKKVRELMASRLDAATADMHWSGDLTLKLRTRPGQLSQVLVILIDNALTHAFAGKQDLRRVEVRVNRSGGSGVRILVADNGRGIPESLREQIFERFFSTRRESGGNGMGLYLARTIVHGQLNGQIRCEADSGGTRFIIDLPLALEE